MEGLLITSGYVCSCFLPYLGQKTTFPRSLFKEDIVATCLRKVGRYFWELPEAGGSPPFSLLLPGRGSAAGTEDTDHSLNRWSDRQHPRWLCLYRMVTLP
jgi:hypothetical protein